MNENFKKNLILGFKTNRLAVVGAAIIIIFSLAAILAPLYPQDPNAISATERLLKPCLEHPFGTDDMGRDYFARCLYGGRTSLLIGFMAMILSTVIGVIIGSISGFIGGIVDVILMRLVDALMSLPTFLIMVVMNAYLDAGVKNVILIIGLLTWMSIARIVRGETLSLKEREYVVYSRVSGQSRMKIILKHVIPNIMPTVIVSATINVAQAILMESALSFFGLGIVPPTSSWGNMLNSSQGYLTTAPYLAIFPGALILLTVISFNYLGEVLRKIYEPN
jgi:peptide/nickel transport system permease protein